MDMELRDVIIIYLHFDVTSQIQTESTEGIQ